MSFKCLGSSDYTSSNFTAAEHVSGSTASPFHTLHKRMFIGVLPYLCIVTYDGSRDYRIKSFKCICTWKLGAQAVIMTELGWKLHKATRKFNSNY